MGKTIHASGLIILVILSGITLKSTNAQQLPGSSRSFNSNPSSTLRGAGMMFTQNKGQISDMNGNACADVLFKGEGAGADIYLRKTGISYVYTNLGEVIHETEEQVEELEKAGKLSKSEIQKFKTELQQNATFKMHRVDMNFAGCNNNITTINTDEAEGYTNYYYDHCPGGITNVKQYNKVIYKNIYNNIDVSYYGNKTTGIKYDVIVNPHADPDQVKLYWTGAEELKIDSYESGGKLKIKTSINEFYESIPKVYQVIDGKVIDVKAEYTLSATLTDDGDGENNKEHIGLNSKDNKSWNVGFKLGKYNPEFPLIIDPWISYYGGSGDDYGISVTTDPSGNVAFTGNTVSANFPVLNAFQSSLGAAAGSAFIVKMNAAGSRLWATYYGGSTASSGAGIACDNNGNTLVTGTAGTNFPVGATGANVVHQSVSGGGGGDAFLLKLDVNGAQLWATYYGGSGYDFGTDVTVDASNNIYLYGTTTSANAISTLASFQAANNGGYDVFIAKFAFDGTRAWGTYAGGSKNDNSTGIAFDPVSGNIYITGYSLSGNFPILNPGGGAYFQGYGGCGCAGFCCNANAFIAKFSPAGAQLWSTYYGAATSGGDYSWGITVDKAGNPIISGYTYSAGFPVTPGAFQTVFLGGNDGFIVKFNSNGVRQWATFLGAAAQNVQAYSTATDANNNIYFLGEFEDTNPGGSYPMSICAYQTNFGGGTPSYPEDQFIAKYNPAGVQTCRTFIGGTGEDDVDAAQSGGGAIAIYGNALYITGVTTGGYPVTAGAFQTAYGGQSSSVYSYGDAFIDQLCINLCEAKVLGLSYSANTTTVCTNTPVKFTPAVSNSCDTTGYKFHWTFTGGNPASSDSMKPTITFPVAGSYSVKLMLTTACKKDSLVKTNYIVVNSCGCNVTASLVSTDVSCGSTNNGSITATASGGTAPFTYSWSNGTSSITSSVTNQILNLTAGTYSVTVTDNSGCSATKSVIINPSLTAQFIKGTATCTGCGCKEWIMVTSSGGTMPYSYSWPSGYNKRYQDKLCPNSYAIIVTDNNGCSINVTVNAP